MFELRLAQFLPQTRVEGPGLRAAIWVQGCPIHCPGCAVPEYWDFHGGTSIRVEDLANKILSIPNLEGVTFAGGRTIHSGYATRPARTDGSSKRSLRHHILWLHHR